ncbi:MAG TPA: porin [Gemmatimonadales bacterium]|nr:porin [Gemmatimonadales bacterium]
MSTPRTPRAVRAAIPALAALATAVALPRAAAAQLSVTVANGWTLTVAGNVNAFYVYEHESHRGEVTSPWATVGRGRHGSAIRTGLLPAFLVVDAQGTEGATRLGVHFGLAPQIQTRGGHDNDSTDTQAGARLDVRQVYLTVGGTWGQVIAGREIGLFGRQNYFTDQTLFGVGAAGGNVGNPSTSTLGHTGSGYLYPGFNAQLTYLAPTRGPFALAVGLFDPSINGDYTVLDAPRLESEATWTTPTTLLWASGLLQVERSRGTDRDAAAWGATAGAKQQLGGLTATLSGYVSRGLGTTSVFNGASAALEHGAGLRPSRGGLAQLAWRPRRGPTTIAAGYGVSTLEAAAGEPEFRITNRSLTLGAYHQATRSLKLVAEATWAGSADGTPARPNRALGGAAGVMLFF